MTRIWILLGCLVVVVDAFAQTDVIPGIGPAGELTRVATGFRFAEGPAADRDGNLYFSDTDASRILRLDTAGKLSIFMSNSRAANGLMFDARGRLVACQMEAGRVVAIDIATREMEVLADGYEGKRFNRPNDLVIDSSGGIYFTDPVFGRIAVPQGVEAVYYIAPDRTVRRLIADLIQPNGVILSPDEATLYVLPSGTPSLMGYPVPAPGKIGQGKAILDLKPDKPRAVCGDGMTIDAAGNLYLARPALCAVQVVSPRGEVLGMIRVPESPSNCTFGGAGRKTLYVTAQTSLYAVPMTAVGFGGRP